VTRFHRDTDNLIDFVSCSGAVQCASRPYGTYANVSRARAQGIEVEADARPVEAAQLHGAYTYTTSTNRTQGSALYGLDLARRPRASGDGFGGLTSAAAWAGAGRAGALGRGELG
jgi:vitamin B12 transporter